MKLVILITTKIEKSLEVAQAWQEAGAPGVTMLRTHGLHTLQQEVRKGSIELPRMMVSMAAAMAYLIDHIEQNGNMLICVVEDNIVEALIKKATDELGDLTAPNTGFMFILPVERAIGVVHHGTD